MNLYIFYFMKRLVLFTCLCFISLTSLAQKKEAVLKVLEVQRIAWNNGDLKEYMQGYWKSDSLVFIGKSGPRYGWQQTLDTYKKGYPDKKSMGFLTFDIMEIRVLGKENAFVVGAWHLKREADDPHGFFTLLLKKVKGQWKIVADHSS